MVKWISQKFPKFKLTVRFCLWILQYNAYIAQWTERDGSNVRVGGSNPSVGALGFK